MKPGRQGETPQGVQVEIQEVTTTEEILRYTPVIAFPSLMIDEKLVCVGRFPKPGEVTGWLKAAVDSALDNSKP